MSLRWAAGTNAPSSRLIIHEDWDLPDPKLLPLEEFRQVRDQIGERVKELAARIEVSNHAKK